MTNKWWIGELMNKFWVKGSIKAHNTVLNEHGLAYSEQYMKEMT